MALTKEEVLKIAKLSKLSFEEKEIEKSNSNNIITIIIIRWNIFDILLPVVSSVLRQMFNISFK